MSIVIWISAWALALRLIGGGRRGSGTAASREICSCVPDKMTDLR